MVAKRVVLNNLQEISNDHLIIITTHVLAIMKGIIQSTTDIDMTVFWDVVPCSLVEFLIRFVPFTASIIRAMLMIRNISSKCFFFYCVK